MRCFNPKCFNGVIVPCGKCLACLEKKQKAWAFRLLEESKKAKNALFVTLTYNDESLPVVDGHPVLNYRDVQLFLKRLRKKVSPLKLRYFVCGEYGTTTFRPHYHMILFDLPIKDYYEAENFLNGVWQHGFTDVKRVSVGRLYYVSKYCVSTSDLPKWYFENRQYKPFIQVSRRPGIGHCFIEDPKNLQRMRDNLETVVHRGGYTYALPRYYRDAVFDDDMKSAILEDYKETDQFKKLCAIFDLMSDSNKRHNLVKGIVGSPAEQRTILQQHLNDCEIFTKRVEDKINKSKRKKS